MSSPSPRAPRLLLGAGLLLVSLAATGMLVAAHLRGLELPGCGAGSACDEASRSVWGSVPGLGWPTAHVGLAWFAGLLVAWCVARGRLGPLATWAVRLGALASLVFVGAMLAGGYLCSYCLAAHGGNLLFLGLVELSRRADAGTPARAVLRPVGGLAGGFFVTTLALAALQERTAVLAGERAEEDLADSTERILRADPAERRGFTGRYLEGPEEAPIRLVVFSDYQCPDCKAIENEIRLLMEERDDVSFSAKHFPFNADCNRMARELNRSLHSNACWAARAAEAAGILGGAESFNAMHRWLFDQGGRFTRETLPPALERMGLDPERFVQTMQGDEPVRRIEADVEEAIALGVNSTPMIFVNGVELKGWSSPRALTRAVHQLAASNPAPASAEDDRPMSGLESVVEEWRRSPALPLPPDEHDWTRGARPGGGEVLEVVVWGDYTNPHTQELDRRVRAALEDDDEARYSFRHYPLSDVCNPHFTREDGSPSSCLAARAVEAAGRLGGPPAAWKMHALLMGAESFTTNDLRRAANAIGLDPTLHRTRMQDEDLDEVIAADARAASQMGLASIPFVFVNDRRVPRWRHDDLPVIETILEEARAEVGR